ncbi:hypothetical protein KSX_72150 [Ktedonospora formicarum]|uniref:Uncharacterized protein n=1 Tax=Ktedonospora formicarum TaxID=2778364 RepID=A0A8J3I2T0_9CHLR|nr:hypothetical protein KSX_72150 [Ktedonospora formicarum]
MCVMMLFGSLPEYESLAEGDNRVREKMLLEASLTLCETAKECKFFSSTQD